jgi:hypothetical protein
MSYLLPWTKRKMANKYQTATANWAGEDNDSCPAEFGQQSRQLLIVQGVLWIQSANGQRIPS